MNRVKFLSLASTGHRSTSTAASTARPAACAQDSRNVAIERPRGRDAASLCVSVCLPRAIGGCPKNGASVRRRRPGDCPLGRKSAGLPESMITTV